MRSFFLSIGLAIGLLTPVLPLHAVQAVVAPLCVGTVFPEFSGRTVTDRPVTRPGYSMKKPTALVFSFSRRAGKDARLWDEHLGRDFPDNVSAYAVIQLGSAPPIFRRLAISGIKSSMPVAVQDQTIVLYHDEQLWKQRLAFKDESRAYVVLLDRTGTIQWISAGAFSDGTYGLLKSSLAKLMQTQP